MASLDPIAHRRSAPLRTLALGAVTLLTLIPIVYGLGFAWFAIGLPVTDPVGDNTADLVAAFVFGVLGGALACGLSRLLIRGGKPVSAALGAAVVVGAFTLGALAITHEYRAVLPPARTLVDGLGLITGILAAALPRP